MKKILFVFMTLFIACMSVNAIPAKPGIWKLLKLTDGSSVRAELQGDEHLHFWQAEDGRLYVETSDEGIYEQIDRVQMQSKARRIKQQKQNLAKSPKFISKKVSTKGKYRGLVILVDYPDKNWLGTSRTLEFQEEHTPDFYRWILNTKTSLECTEEGNKLLEAGYVGSVFDYFYTQSGTDFHIQFDVAGPYTLSHERSYYGKNDPEITESNVKDEASIDMIVEACELADKDVNFTQYDWDNDDIIDMVYVIYSGEGEASGGPANSIWPQSGHVYSDEDELTSPLTCKDGQKHSLVFDGKRLFRFACSNELEDNDEGGCIGTICHEFSHCLGLMDHYVVLDNSQYATGHWDIMHKGSYNGNGKIPAGFNSFEKFFCGWLTPIDVKNVASGKVEGLKSLSEGGDAYIVKNRGHEDEYYLIENRQKKGWDSALPGEGVLITHVDYNAEIYLKNRINGDETTEDKHLRLTIIPADGDATYKTEAYDAYPYDNNTELSKTSTPPASVFNKNSDGTYYMNYAIKNISISNGLASFQILDEMPSYEKRRLVYSRQVGGKTYSLYKAIDKSDFHTNADGWNHYRTWFTLDIRDRSHSQIVTIDKGSLYTSEGLFDNGMTPCMLMDIPNNRMWIFANSKTNGRDYKMDGFVYTSPIDKPNFKKEQVFSSSNWGWFSFFTGVDDGQPILYHFSYAGYYDMTARRSANGSWSNSKGSYRKPESANAQWQATNLMTVVGNAYKDEVDIDNMTYTVKGENSAVVSSSYSNRSAEEVKIPASIEVDGESMEITGIAPYTFYNYSNMKSLTIPASVKEIGEYAFANCSNLAELYVNATEPAVMLFSEDYPQANARRKTGVSDDESVSQFYGIDKSTCILYVPQGCAEKYRSAKGWGEFINIVEFQSQQDDDGLAIGDVFTEDTKEGVTVRYAVLSKSPMQVEVKCTDDYDAAISQDTEGIVTIPETVRGYKVVSLSDCALSMCRKVTKFVLPKTVTRLESNAISFNDELEVVEGLEALEYIGRLAFAYCPKLKEFTIPETVTFIGAQAFRNSSSLTALNIPKSVIEIEDNFVLAGCTGLTQISVDSDNPYYDSREGCNAIIETATNKLVAGCGNTTIPTTITQISDGAFSELDNLKSITIPAGVTSIGYMAFESCTSLVWVKVMSENPIEINNNTFKNVNVNNVILYVPEGCIEKYLYSNGWKAFGRILEAPQSGDINGDGKIDIQDITDTINAILFSSIPGPDKSAADMNDDGVINIADLIILINMMTGDN